MRRRLPRFHSAAHRLHDRRKFLDGTLLAYFAPGQTPQVAEGGDNYSPPDDWPPARSLLRPPQVVWLTCETPDNFPTTYLQTHDYNPIETAFVNEVQGHFTGTVCPPTIFSFGNPSYPTHTDQLIGFANSDGAYFYQYSNGDLSTYTGDPCSEVLTVIAPFVTTTVGDMVGTHTGWYHQEITNAYNTIYRRFHDTVFPAVRDAVASARPGRTWAQPLAFFDEDGNSTYWPPDGDLSHAVTWTPLIAPSRFDGYFGVEFLHIHIGYPLEPVSGAQLTEINPDDAVFGQAEARVRHAATGFVRFSVKVYSIKPTWDDYPAAPAKPQITDIPSTPTLRVSSSTPPLNDTRSGATLWTAVDPAFVASQFTAHDFSSAGLNADLVATVQAYRDNDTDNDTLLQALASYFDGIVEYGGQGDDLDADAILGVIAGHFGFDPHTGKDLPG